MLAWRASNRKNYDLQVTIIDQSKQFSNDSAFRRNLFERRI